MGGIDQLADSWENVVSLVSLTGFCLLSELDKWEISRTDLEMGRELGSGQFGRVMQAVYRRQTEVAVKMMKEGSMLEEDFIEEAKIMKNFQHDNLVQLYGVCIQGGPLYLVTELMVNGKSPNVASVLNRSLCNLTAIMLQILFESVWFASNTDSISLESFLLEDQIQQNVNFTFKGCKVWIMTKED